jgi:hypothetical protein
MKLLLVHGINQQEREAADLQSSWLGWLGDAMPERGVLDRAEVQTPFYGKTLYNLMRGRGVNAVIEQGTGDSIDAEELAFISGAMEEVGQTAGLTAKEVAMEQRADEASAVEQGLLMNRRVNAIGRLLEKYSPAHGRFVLPLVRQAYAYLRKPGVAAGVDAIVGGNLDPAVRTVVVAHSLGTVVTFKLMRALAQAGRPVSCPLYVTLGSPLGLRAVSAALGVPFEIPPGVERWVNAVEPRDAVTLGKPLDADTFVDGIENILDISNTQSDGPHDVQGYLSDRRIATKIEMALR